MDLIPFLCLLTFSLPSIRSAPQPQLDVLDIFDTDDAEIAVPRSPQILGPQTEYWIFPIRYKIENLTCEVTGIPMPKVIWLKDGVGVQQLEPPLKEDFSAETGLSTLRFPNDPSKTPDNGRVWAGNYTCVAANFLGRASKFQIVTFANTTPDSDIMSTAPFPTTTETTQIP